MTCRVETHAFDSHATVLYLHVYMCFYDKISDISHASVIMP